MVVVPMVTGLANPVEMMTATLGALDTQSTRFVTLVNVPSEKVAVAVNCCVWSDDREIEAFVGLIVRAVTVLLLTVSVVLAVTLLLDVAVIEVVPRAIPVAKPEPLM